MIFSLYSCTNSNAEQEYNISTNEKEYTTQKLKDFSKKNYLEKS
jgi:hypothetical protein